jgi:hypothetical protein
MFAKTPVDMQFRKLVAEKLSAARKEVVIVTGEFSAFTMYIELQMAVRNAIKRGVRFSIYANGLPPGTTRKLLRWGCTLHTGPAVAPDHFMLVDDSEAIISRKHPPSSVGHRHGLVTRRRPGHFRSIYRALASQGKRVMAERRPDPMRAFLDGPPFAAIRGAHRNIDEAVSRQ